VLVVVIVVVVLVVIGLAVLASYNRFVRQRNLIDNAWSNVDTELKRRYDLVPNLVQTVKGYASHEASTLTEVTQARAQAIAETGSPDDQARTENALVGSLRSLLAVSEAYPDLKADTGFLGLQHQLVETEDRIQAARRLYNNDVRAYNERVQSVPTNVVARLGHFDQREYFEVDEAVVTAAPAVDLGGAGGSPGASDVGSAAAREEGSASGATEPDRPDGS
jgi:LemA protein